jgi:hypothetical protein
VWGISYLEPDNPSAGSASLLPVRHTQYTLPRLPRVHGHNWPGRGQEDQSPGASALSGLRDESRSRSAQGSQSFARKGVRAVSSSRASCARACTLRRASIAMLLGTFIARYRLQLHHHHHHHYVVLVLPSKVDRASTLENTSAMKTPGVVNPDPAARCPHNPPPASSRTAASGSAPRRLKWSATVS